jgi:hypothetical protein
MEPACSLAIHPRSGSVVLHFPPGDQAAVENSLHKLFPDLTVGGASAAASGGGKQSSFAKSHRFLDRDLSDDVVHLFRHINEDVEKATGGMDLKFLVPVLLLAFSVLGVATSAAKKGKFPVPSWYDLLWFAFNTYVILNLTLAQRDESDTSAGTDVSPENAAKGRI